MSVAPPVLSQEGRPEQPTSRPGVLRRNTRPAGAAAPFEAIDLDYWLGREPGDPELTPAQVEAARLAWDWLSLVLAAAFPHGRPRLHPGDTGRELMSRVLPYPRGAAPGAAAAYVCLPERELAAVAGGGTQHRFEVFASKAAGVTRLHRFDARVAYLAACNEVPVLHTPADLVHDEAAAVDPHRRGFYRVGVRVPAGWDRPGIVHAQAREGGTRYPFRPGAVFDTWLETRDVHRLTRHGWAFAVRERILGAPSARAAGGAGGAQPLAEWARRLAALVEKAERNVAPAPIVRRAALVGVDVAAAADVYRAFLRRIAVVAIGQLHQRHHTSRSVYASLDAAPPLDPGATTRTLPDGTVEVRTPRPFSSTRALWRHPEWSTAIWTAARATTGNRLLDQPAGAVVAIDGDAVYIDAELAQMRPDDGLVGRLRPKGAVLLRRPLVTRHGGDLGELRERFERELGEAARA